MKKFDVCGLGNALVDLLFECSEDEFTSLNMKKGSMSLIDAAAQRSIISRLGSPVGMASGGSVANSVAIIGQQGGRAALICSLADDEHGNFFREDLAKFGIEVSSRQLPSSDYHSGTSLVVVTPDAERTMSTSLGASAELSPTHLNGELIRDSRWLFIEGYLIANGDNARQTILDAVKCARASGTKTALTLSDAFVVNGFRDFLDSILPDMDLVFCNNTEAASLAGESDVERSFEILRNRHSGVVVTAGPRGAYVSYNGSVAHSEAYACEPVDLTGAGDAFAGSFLLGLSSDLSAFESAKKGCFYASKVIQQWGARLRADMHQLHKEFTQG